MADLVTNDGVGLHYEERGEGRPVVLMHGWTFSGKFFFRNAQALAENFGVITLDLRGHGDSEKPNHGYRVSRFARDLYDLLDALDLEDVTVVGWSLGCPVIWSYLELFGSHRLAGVDNQQLATFFSTAPTDEERDLLLSEMAKSPPEARNATMADHTRHDWRDLLPGIRLPSLVLVACKDSVFAWRGLAHAGEAIPGAETVFFEESRPGPFFDEPEKFNETVARFVTGSKVRA